MISTDSSVFTYTIDDGVAVFAGLGDQHDQKYSKYSRSTPLLADGVHVTSTTKYTITFYPRREFESKYTTNTPVIAVIVLVGVFLFCALVFAAYDILMHGEFGRKQAVLDTKRRFVRFISHEIRTPLNTVRLGLQLFEVELSNLLAKVKRTAQVDLPKLVNNALLSWQQLTADVLENR